MRNAARVASQQDIEATPSAAAVRPGAEILEQAAHAAFLGDRSALRTFLRIVEPSVRRVCRGVMGRDSPDLEDAIQDSLMDVARGLPRFRFECSSFHYVTRIALRRAILTRRRARARWMRQSPVDLETLTITGFDRALEGRAELLRRMLDDLNEDQAKAILLRIVMGCSIEEIAAITGVSVNTVKTRLRLGKDQLRRWLERSGERRRGRENG